MSDHDSAPPDRGRDEIAEHHRKDTAKAQLFDIRTVIGGLFVLYGVLIGTAGVFTTQQALRKAQGININLWTGVAMLLVGAVFLVWVKLRPLSPQPSDADKPEPM